MAEQQVKTICVVLSEHLTNHYSGPLAKGAAYAAAYFGCRLLLYSPLHIFLDRRPLGLDDFPLLTRRADAYLIPGFVDDEVLAHCRQRGAALLTYADLRAGVPAIGPNNREGARMVTAHLINQGRRRIVHLRGQEDSIEANERVQGYRDALEAAGLPFDPLLVRVGAFRAYEAEIAIDRLLAEDIVFDAVFAANDISARGALTSLERAGLRVPQDIALAGFDDAAGSDTMTPPLTTVRQSAFQIGWDAVDALLHRPYELPHLLQTPVSLVVRQSCGAAAARRHGELDRLVEALGSGQGPLVTPREAAAWLQEIDAALRSAPAWQEPFRAALARARARGLNLLALGEHLDRVMLEHEPTSAAAARNARRLLSDEAERLNVESRHERAARLTGVSYVHDLLRLYTAEQASEIVLRYIVSSGPRGAISAQQLGSSGAIAARWVADDGAPRQWQGVIETFPPPAWLRPGDTLLVMPMESGNQTTIMGVIEREGRDHLDLDDLLLRSINTYRSIAALHTTMRELEIARRVQENLLPRRAPAIGGYDIAGTSRTARQVGGDLYGYYPHPQGGMAVAVGDVAGKGMPAALLMSACVTALASVVQAGRSPGQSLDQMHRALQPSIGRTQNAAVCLAYLATDGAGRVQVASAGAVAPVVLDASAARLIDVVGLPLGTPLSGLQPYREVEIRLMPGDLLILSSDGIVEAWNEHGEIFGFERFLAAIAAGPRDSAADMLEHIMAEVALFSGDMEIQDDIALVVVRYVG